MHGAARLVAPDTRIVYVDNDPIVLAHAAELLVDDDMTAYVHEDLRHPERILRRAAATLDFREPVGLVLVGVLHLIEDRDDPWGLVAELVDALAVGSYVVISHMASDIEAEMTEAAERANATMRAGALPRAEPVRDLLAAVEHVAEHHRRMRLVDLVAFDMIDHCVRWRRGPVVAAPLASARPVPVLAVVGVPVRVLAGLDHHEHARLATYRARLDGLVAQLTLTTSWSGLAVVGWFMATGLRGPRNTHPLRRVSRESGQPRYGQSGLGARRERMCRSRLAPIALSMPCRRSSGCI